MTSQLNSLNIFSVMFPKSILFHLILGYFWIQTPMFVITATNQITFFITLSNQHFTSYKVNLQETLHSKCYGVKTARRSTIGLSCWKFIGKKGERGGLERRGAKACFFRGAAGKGRVNRRVCF